jgi:hypothetical protein
MEGVIDQKLRLSAKTDADNPSGDSCVVELVTALDAYLERWRGAS